MTPSDLWVTDQRSRFRRCLILLVAAGWLNGSAVDVARAAEPAPADERARQYFTDETVVDQDGRSHRFYSDLLAGHTVLIHAFYAQCREACPLQVDRLRLVRGHDSARLSEQQCGFCL